MPTKRKRTTRKAGDHISEAAIAAYRAGDRNALCFAIGQAPWEFSPLDVYEGPPPAWIVRPDRLEYWAKALEMRRALEAAQVDFGYMCREPR